MGHLCSIIRPQIGSLLITGLPEVDNEFTGYGWVIGNFDAIAGTYNVTIFGLGFTQNFELTPTVGPGSLGGLQLNAPPEL